MTRMQGPTRALRQGGAPVGDPLREQCGYERDSVRLQNQAGPAPPCDTHMVHSHHAYGTQGEGRIPELLPKPGGHTEGHVPHRTPSATPAGAPACPRPTETGAVPPSPRLPHARIKLGRLGGFRLSLPNQAWSPAGGQEAGNARAVTSPPDVHLQGLLMVTPTGPAHPSIQQNPCV